MKRSMIAAILAAAVLATLATSAGASSRPWRQRECRYQTLDGHAGWTRTEVIKTIQCAAHKFGVSTSTALYVADRESHYFPRARNSSSGTCGLFQHQPSLWAGRYRALLHDRPHLRPLSPSCFDPRTNALVSMHMVRIGGWGPWGM